jgi:hypothetical protein
MNSGNLFRMKKFFLFSAFYLVAAVALLFILRDDPLGTLTYTLISAVNDSKFLLSKWPYLLPLLGIGWYVTRAQGCKHLLVPTLHAFFGCLMFSAAFGMVKINIPYVVPFYADEMLANADAALHFGHDPWVLVHTLADYIPYRALEILYFDMWLLPAWFLPLSMVLTDSNIERTNRYLVLFVFCWVGLGNVVATMFSSVGPVYYDRLMGTERFVGLTLALESSGLTGSIMGGVQEYLWMQYNENGQSFGSGISAFPSVHVGVAAVVAFYLAERSRYLMPLGLVFLAAISFASVYNGWHYAVDGYVSILLITAAWAVMTRRKVTFPRVVAA